MPRWSHQPLKYKDYTIPAGTIFSCTSLTLHRDETVFPHADEFRPERWIEADKEGRKQELERYLVPFSRGTRQCVGLNLGMLPFCIDRLPLSSKHELDLMLTLSAAWTEMYLTLASIVMKFDFEIYDTTWERDVKIDREWFVGMPSGEAQGVKVKITEVF